MAYNIQTIFDNMDRMVKVKTRSEYEAYTNTFKERALTELKQVYEGDYATETKALVEDIFNTFVRRGKVRTNELISLNYFFIYYIFPTILSECPENGEAVCDALRDSYNTRFDANINYTTYDKLYDGFITKIFGIPIPGRN